MAVVSNVGGSIYAYAILVHNGPVSINGTGLQVSWDNVGKTVSWYTTEASGTYGPTYQLNHSRAAYYYVAIG